MSECCEAMRAQMNWICHLHKDPFECSDALVHRFKDGTMGLIIHDGGGSISRISFCPWCGTPTQRSTERNPKD
jgi:hypothetical protein